MNSFQGLNHFNFLKDILVDKRLYQTVKKTKNCKPLSFKFWRFELNFAILLILVHVIYNLKPDWTQSLIIKCNLLLLKLTEFQSFIAYQIFCIENFHVLSLQILFFTLKTGFKMHFY